LRVGDLMVGVDLGEPDVHDLCNQPHDPFDRRSNNCSRPVARVIS
jgi:hypothetical protein